MGLEWVYLVKPSELLHPESPRSGVGTEMDLCTADNIRTDNNEEVSMERRPKLVRDFTNLNLILFAFKKYSTVGPG